MTVKLSNVSNMRGAGRANIPVPINAGVSSTEGIDTAATTILGIVMPAGWDAADITILTSHDDVTYQPLYDDSGEYVISTAAAGRNIVLEPDVLAGWRFIRIRSGTDAVPVNQTAIRTLILIVRTLLGG